MSDLTTLRIHYNAGWQNSIYVRGANGLDWDAGALAKWKEGNVWIHSWSDDGKPIECKVLINDRQWCIGSNYSLTPGRQHDIYPHFHTKSGSLEVIYHFETPIVIYRPPSYYENPFKHYPVLYMHDGQNLFDPATAFRGQTWGAGVTLDALINEGKMEEVIAVGIYNRGAGRLYDFTPSHDPEFMGVGAGGGADSYLELIVEEIKPHIDTHYRTRPEKEFCGLLGSSLGGLVSFYMARQRPDVFSKIAALSSSFWWNQRNLIRRIIDWRAEPELGRSEMPELKIYLDAGSFDNQVETLEMYRVLLDIGYRQGENLYCHIAEWHAHSERYWGQRLHLPLQFLFPPNGVHHRENWPEEKIVRATEISCAAEPSV